MCNLTDKDFSLNIYDVAGVYEHKRISNSYTAKLEKYFSTITYFANHYVPGELTPIPKLKENGAFITGFIEIITAILPDFDMSCLKECVLSYGDNYNKWYNNRKIKINEYISSLEKESLKVMNDINTLSPKEAAYFAGKYSIFLNYEYYRFIDTSIIEAFFVCKSKLPYKYRAEFFAHKFAYNKYFKQPQKVDDVIIATSFEDGMMASLKVIFRNERLIGNAISDLSYSSANTILRLPS